MTKKQLKYSMNQLINHAESARCKDLHHRKKDMHDYDVMCPVEYELHKHANNLKEYIKSIVHQ